MNRTSLAKVWLLLLVVGAVLPRAARAQPVVIDFDGNYPDGTPITGLDLFDTEFETLGAHFSTVQVAPGGLPAVAVGQPLAFSTVSPQAIVSTTAVAASPPNHFSASNGTDDPLIEFVEPCAPHNPATTSSFSLDLDNEQFFLGDDPVVLYALDIENRVLAATVTNDSQQGTVSVAAEGIAKVVLDFTSLAGDDEGYDNVTYTPAACPPRDLPGLGRWGVAALLVALTGFAWRLHARSREGLVG